MSFNKAVERKAKLELEIEQMKKQVLLIKNQVSKDRRRRQAHSKIVLAAEMLKMSLKDDEVKNFVRLLADKILPSNIEAYEFMITEYPHLELSITKLEKAKEEKAERDDLAKIEKAKKLEESNQGKKLGSLEKCN